MPKISRHLTSSYGYSRGVPSHGLGGPRREGPYSSAVGSWAVPVRPSTGIAGFIHPARSGYPYPGLDITTNERLGVRGSAGRRLHPARERVSFRLETP